MIYVIYENMPRFAYAFRGFHIVYCKAFAIHKIGLGIG